MNKSRRLKRMSRRFLGHFVSGQFSQFVVNDRQQLLCRRSIAALEPIKNVRQIAHAQMINQSSPMWNNIAPLHTRRFAFEGESQTDTDAICFYRARCSMIDEKDPCLN